MTSRATARNAVTPLVLTYNEALTNIGRCLDSVAWAQRVVVLDSGSTDQTCAIAGTYPNVEIFTRPFDDFRRQTDHGLGHTGITTEYALALDADMVVTPALVAEIEGPFLDGAYAGGLLPFTYRILGRPLLGSLLAPQLRVFRRAAVTVVQERTRPQVRGRGAVRHFAARLVHDDRKPLPSPLGGCIAGRLLQK